MTSRLVDAVDLPQQCTGQLIEVAPERYDWLWLDLDATTPVADEVWLYYRGGLDAEPLSVPAGASTIRIGVARRDELRQVRLPQAPTVALTAMTLVRTPIEGEGTTP